MRGWIALIAIVFCLPAFAGAAPRWTFCVAASQTGKDVWITQVFAAERDRQRLEEIFTAMLERAGAPQADAQCPLPNADKTEAVDAQFDAAAFNRRLGARLHEVDANAFPPPR